MTGLNGFQKSLHSCVSGERSLSIGRVKAAKGKNWLIDYLQIFVRTGNSIDFKIKVTVTISSGNCDNNNLLNKGGPSVFCKAWLHIKLI